MNLLHARGVYIQGPCSVLPDKTMTNEDMVRWTNSSHPPAVISFSTGILKRRWVTEEQACSDLAILAAEALFAQKKEAKNTISQLILATISGDYLSPPTSPLIQHRLKLKGVGVFDLGAACAGFVAGLHTGAAFAQTTSGSVLLIASEIRSKFLNNRDFASSVLFGDGAAACIMTGDKQGADFRLIASALFSDGEVGDIISIPAGGSRFPASRCSDIKQHFIHIKESTALFVKAVSGMTDCAKDFLKKMDLRVEQIDWLIPHQGNKHLVLSVAKQLGFVEEKVVNVVEQTGNTSGASVGIALDYLKRRADLQVGSKILLVAAGGGGIAGCALLEVLGG